jgi:regulator of PEP synthase PpsR (kinase-PPPase family)
MSEDDVRLPQQVYIVSDGTGSTAEKVVRAGLRQFRGHIVHLRTFPEVEGADQIGAIMRRARRNGALVVTTLVHPAAREVAERLAHELQVQHIDVLGGLLGGLERYLDATPVGVPGLLHTADEQYFRRIDAVEFTVKADDGQEPTMLHEADIVLVGVSRTSKTPLSTFLAHKGFKVANVPIVLEKRPPPELFQIDQRKVFALTIDPEVLETIRRSRIRAMGASRYANYADSDYILAELEFAMELFRGNPKWPIIDVTNRALEETAATLLQTYHDSGFTVPDGEVGAL